MVSAMMAFLAISYDMGWQDKTLLLDELRVKLFTSKRGTPPAEYVRVCTSQDNGQILTTVERIILAIPSQWRQGLQQKSTSMPKHVVSATLPL